jgi:ketosteroid isomerase-like protein
MKTGLCFMICILVFGTNATAQKTNSGSALQAIVETERAFSNASKEKGTRESFMAFIAEDGILFRPTAVKGKQWMLEHPVPPSPKRGLLTWQPIVAGVSDAGDMGYTTGPWEFKQDSHDEKPVAFGNFMTVWKKQPDGSWKFAVDLGISNPQPTAPIAPWQAPEKNTNTGSKSANVDVASASATLLKLEREFSNASASQGALKRFLSHSANEVRLFREGSFPFVGKDAAKQALAANKNVWTWQPQFADVARSGDLGYTYGVYELRSNDAAMALAEKGNYLRIWKRQNGGWKVLIDVANPLPPEEKKN